jgi:3D (Asp-Asp-Asp) domain-containing protein
LERRWGWVAPFVAVLALAAGLLAPAGGADAGTRAERLRERGAALARAEHRALLELYAAEATLGRAQAGLSDAESLLSALAREQAAARRRTAVVHRSLATSHRRVAALLRALYVNGEADPIAVVLGASSLDEMLAGIDGLQRATAQSRRLVREAEEHARLLAGLQARLASRRTVLEAARAAAARAARRLGDAAGERRATLASIRSRGALTTRRLAELQSQARAAERASTRISREAVAPAAAPVAADGVSGGAADETIAAAPPVPSAGAPRGGTLALVVDAVAYHLPGHTASGLPVGHGIVAVDPAVIPLGTRMFVPGYGPAIAADVGSAVRGNIIDLWMPSRAAALGWGRRTVTITIYG